MEMIYNAFTLMRWREEEGEKSKIYTDTNKRIYCSRKYVQKWMFNDTRIEAARIAERPL